MKKLIIGLLAVALLSIGSQALASHTTTQVGSTVQRLSPSTVSFQPGSGQQASIQYEVRDQTAQNFTIFLYQASERRNQDVGICNRSSTYYIGNIEGPTDKVTGTYTARWPGLRSDNTAYPEGYYCYHVQWSNPPIGALGFVDGLIYLQSGGTVTGGTGTGGTGGTGTGGTGTGGTGTGGTGTGGTGTGGTGGTGTGGTGTGGTGTGGTGTGTGGTGTGGSQTLCTNQTGFVDAQANRTTLDLVNRTPVQITYKVCIGITRGTSFSYGIYNASGVPVYLGFSHNQGVASGFSETVSWDGTGVGVQAGNTYYYRFRVNGYTDAQGSILVTSAATGTGTTGGGSAGGGDGQQLSVIHSTNPRDGILYVDTSRNVAQNSVTINFDLGRSVTPQTAFSIVITGTNLQSPLVLYSTNLSVRSGSITWDGFIGSRVAQPGSYSYLIRLNGVTLASGFIDVKAVSVQQPDQNIIVSDLTVDHSTFNPYPPLNETVRIGFRLNRDARADVTILDANNRTVRVLPTSGNNQFFAGANSVVWDGRDQNGVVAVGLYSFVIRAIGGNSVSGNLRVVSDSTGGTGLFKIDDLSLFPNPFNPNREQQDIRFRLNDRARVTIRVRSQRTQEFVRDIVTDKFFDAASNTQPWNGLDRSGYTLSDGLYTISIEGRSERNGETDSRTIVSTIDTFGTGGGTSERFRILEYSHQPSSFSPRTQDTVTITFTTSHNPSFIEVRVAGDSSNAHIANLPVEEIGTRTYRARWNGRDFSNNRLVKGESYYRYFIRAQRANVTDQVSGRIYVSDTGTAGGGTTIRTGDCGGFTDVSKNNALCDAIEFVTERGIFMGYPNSTLRLENIINRAEAAAVLRKAFRFPLDEYDQDRDGDLGFSDLRGREREWYMPYLKTFVRRGLLAGYPDGRMRPERTMNTAELYLVFFKAAEASPYAITNYSIEPSVRHAPYDDTPINSDTRWYIRYAAFAQLNGLVTGSKFNPGKGITRGQVIKLLYDSYRKGLIDYPDGDFEDRTLTSDRSDRCPADRYNRDSRGDYNYDRFGSYYYDRSINEFRRVSELGCYDNTSSGTSGGTSTVRYSRDSSGRYYEDTSGIYYRDSSGNYYQY